MRKVIGPLSTVRIFSSVTAPRTCCCLLVPGSLCAAFHKRYTRGTGRGCRGCYHSQSYNNPDIALTPITLTLSQRSNQKYLSQRPNQECLIQRPNQKCLIERSNQECLIQRSNQKCLSQRSNQNMPIVTGLDVEMVGLHA